MADSAWAISLSTAVASGAIGVLGVLAGSWLTARHDDRRWERELNQEHDRWRREDDRRWADERRKVYAQYLAAIDPWIQRTRHWKPPYFDADVTSDQLREQEPDFDVHAVIGETDGPSADIQLIGSEETTEAARSLVAQLLAFEACHIAGYTRDVLGGMAQECEKRFNKLQAAFRTDLGIPDETPLGVTG